MTRTVPRRRIAALIAVAIATLLMADACPSPDWKKVSAGAPISTSFQCPFCSPDRL